ncbi:Uncharacterised protein [Vibrio cholerae]|nr:Uncharacterised protein [Vibrio cholerae]
MLTTWYCTSKLFANVSTTSCGDVVLSAQPLNEVNTAIEIRLFFSIIMTLN